jgi:hypothetical protein
MAPDPPRPDGGRADQGPQPEPLHELTLGRRAPSPVEPRPHHDLTSSEVFADADLDSIEARCRIKAEAARRAAERQRRIREGAGFQDEDALVERELIDWAETLTDCFYWLDTPDGSTPDCALLDEVGGCFEAVAEASSLVAQEGRRGAIARSRPLLAEAQSALRRALQRLQAPNELPAVLASGPEALQEPGHLRLKVKTDVIGDKHPRRDFVPPRERMAC